jgi:hypothetical protein
MSKIYKYNYKTKIIPESVYTKKIFAKMMQWRRCNGADCMDHDLNINSIPRTAMAFEYNDNQYYIAYSKKGYYNTRMHVVSFDKRNAKYLSFFNTILIQNQNQLIRYKYSDRMLKYSKFMYDTKYIRAYKW